MQEEEYLNASKQNMCWAPCLIFEYSLADHNFERKPWRTIEEWKESLTNHHVEPQWRTPVIKERSNKRKVEKNEKKPCNDLDGASRRDNAESLELRKRKRWSISNREMWHDEQLWKEETRSLGWNNNKNYIMPIVHQFKLMTSNRFGILLILVERIKRDIAQTWENSSMIHR